MTTKIWGLLPTDIQPLLLKREWQNETNRKARLLHQRPWPIRVNLKPPSGNNATTDLAHFQQFVQAWQQYSYPQQVKWQQVTYRALSTQHIPTTLVLANITELMHFLEGDAYQCYQRWQQRIKPLEPVQNLLIANTKKANTTICKLVFIFLSQFFHSRRHFSIQPNERSTTQRFGITANLCNSLRLATSTVAPMISCIASAKRSPV